MRISRTRTTSLIGALAITGLLLTGCAGGQSKADACKVLQSGLTDVQSDLNSSLSNATTDPKGTATAMQAASDKFSKNVVSKISNDEVKGATQDFDKALGTLVSEFKTYSENPASGDTKGVSDASTGLQDSSAAIAKACS